MDTTPAVDSPLELEPTSAEVKSYQKKKLLAGLASTGLSFAFLGFMALAAGPVLGPVLAEKMGGCPWLTLAAMALVLGVGLEILTSPIDFWSSFIVEHQYQLSNQTLGGWFWRRLKGYLVGGIFGLALLLGLYAVLWSAGPWWWLWATAGWLVVTLVLGQLLPVVILPLFYKVTPLDDDSLRQRLQRLTEGTGLTIEGVYRLHLSEETRKANAALAGMGRTRRVLLGDTLLDKFTPEEIEVVFAHEVGHHVYHHLLKNVLFRVLLTAGGFWLVDVLLRALAAALGYQGLADPAALPLLLLVLGLFSLVLSPLQNALSRFFEVQCDRYALVKTGLTEAYRSAFIKLARINKADADPHPLVAWLFYDHPPIRQRLALAAEVGKRLG